MMSNDQPIGMSATESIERTSPQLKAAANFLLQTGNRHGWWKESVPTMTQYSCLTEFAFADPIGCDEFIGLVHDMFEVARKEPHR